MERHESRHGEPLWAEGMAEWVRADAIEGLLPDTPAPPPLITQPSPAARSGHAPPLRRTPAMPIRGGWSFQQGPAYFSMGKYLVVRNGAVLAHVCPISNRPTGPRNWRKTVRIYYHPQWIIAIWVLPLTAGDRFAVRRSEGKWVGQHRHAVPRGAAAVFRESTPFPPFSEPSFSPLRVGVAFLTAGASAKEVAKPPHAHQPLKAIS